MTTTTLTTNAIDGKVALDSHTYLTPSDARALALRLYEVAYSIDAGRGDLPTPEPVPAFSGDWEWNDTLDCYETAYEAVGYSAPMSYGVSPIVTRNVLEALAARQEMLGAMKDGIPWDRIISDGNGFMISPAEEDGSDGWSHLLPNAEGNFDLSQLGYCFSALDADDNVIRTIPS